MAPVSLNDKLKIGIVCYPTIGGSGIVATQLGQALCLLRYEVHFISHDYPQRLGELKNHCTFHHINVPTYPLFRYPPYTLALATELYRIIQQVGLHVLHVHYAIPHSTSAVLANLMLEDKGLDRIPLVTTVHGTDTELVGMDPVYRSAIEFSLNHCDAITAVSESLKKSTLESFECRNDIQVIHNFIDPLIFHPPAKVRFPRKEDKWQIIHISNFRPVKRIQDIIRAFDSISQCIPCHLLMVGDGPERPGAEEMVCSLGLSSQVTFTGKVLTVESLLRESDILLCVSESETFGMSIAEGMASGLPVVATRIGGIPEVVVHGETGFLTEVGDINKIAESLLQIMTSPDLAKTMGQAGRSRIEDYFSPQAIVPKYESVYRSLIEDRSLKSLNHD